MEKQSPTSKKMPFKLFEHSLTQFNDVVIPHRLDMMKKHRCNIEKAINLGDFRSAGREQSAAKMLIQNLKRDLSEIEDLRSQVDVHDLNQFDKAIESSRSKALAALDEYMRLGEKLLSPEHRRKTQNSDEENTMPTSDATPQLQVLMGKQPVLDKDEEEYVRSWENLRDDIECLHSIYADLHSLTQDQGQLVDNIEENVANTLESVHQGNIHLKRALSYKSAAYPLLGAAIGAAIGGPVGLILSLKLAGCAAVGAGGGIVGFVGGKLLQKTVVNVSSEGESYPVIGDNSSSKPHQS